MRRERRRRFGAAASFASARRSRRAPGISSVEPPQEPRHQKFDDEYIIYN